MMWLIINPDASVRIASPYWIEGASLAKTVPADFLATFALGKYKARASDGQAEIYAVDGWVAPEAPADV